MAELKTSLRIEPIAKADAIRLLDARHPLGAGSKLFSFALGVFWDGKIEGVMVWGSPQVNGAGTSLRLRQSEILELRKMWLSDAPPKNAESRSLAVAARIIRKRYPQLRLLMTYCHGEDKASSYKGAGWVEVSRSTHAAEMENAAGDRLSAREYNRRGGKKALGETWTKVVVNTTKWVLVLDQSVAAMVQEQHARLPTGK